MSHKAFTPMQAKVLFAIWELQASTPNRAITSMDLAKNLSLSPGYVRMIIMGIEKLSGNYLVKRTYFAGKRFGRPGTSYHLNIDKVAVLPETALILLELSKYPTDKAFRIDKANFAEHAAKKYDLSREYVQAKISWAIENGYIRELEKDYIYPDSRLSGEEAYLELITSHAYPRKSSRRSVTKTKNKEGKKKE